MDLHNNTILFVVAYRMTLKFLSFELVEYLHPFVKRTFLSKFQNILF